MVRKLQRLGGGPVSVAANSCRASAPGACCKRSCNSSVRSKGPPMRATLLKPEHATAAEALIQIEPAVDSVGVARFQETSAGDGMGALAIGHLQQGGTAFADIGARVVVPVVTQLLALAEIGRAHV